MLDKSTFRRAAGEVGMIVVGVLTALAASDWQQDRTDRRGALDMLHELRVALDMDPAALAQMERYQRIEARVETLLDVLNAGAPYADSLDSYFGTLYGIEFPKLNRAGYESLKSQGLDNISDDALED